MYFCLIAENDSSKFTKVTAKWKKKSTDLFGDKIQHCSSFKKLWLR